jgi:hypothetical protein
MKVKQQKKNLLKLFHWCSCVLLSFFSFSFVNKLKPQYATVGVLCFVFILPPPMHVLFTFQTINYGDFFTTFPHHFFVPTTMESSTPNANASVQVEPNALGVVGRLARCSSNNIVNGSK